MKGVIVIFWFILIVLGLVLLLFPFDGEDKPALTPTEEELAAMIEMWDDEEK